MTTAPRRGRAASPTRLLLVLVPVAGVALWLGGYGVGWEAWEASRIYPTRTDAPCLQLQRGLVAGRSLDYWKLAFVRAAPVGVVAGGDGSLQLQALAACPEGGRVVADWADHDVLSMDVAVVRPEGRWRLSPPGSGRFTVQRPDGLVLQVGLDTFDFRLFSPFHVGDGERVWLQRYDDDRIRYLVIDLRSARAHEYAIPHADLFELAPGDRRDIAGTAVPVTVEPLRPPADGTAFTSEVPSPLVRTGLIPPNEVTFTGEASVGGRLEVTRTPGYAGAAAIYGVFLVPDVGSRRHLPHASDDAPVSEIWLRNTDDAMAWLLDDAQRAALADGRETRVVSTVNVRITEFRSSVDCDQRGYSAVVLAHAAQAWPLAAAPAAEADAGSVGC